MKCNVGKKDRLFRIFIGAGVLIAHYVSYGITGHYCVWANLAYIPLLTGIFKICPLYYPFKINTIKKKD